MKRSPLKSDPEKTAAFVQRARENSKLSSPTGKNGAKSRPSFTPASKEQRAKVKGALCIVCGPFTIVMDDPIDAAHLCARARGGCDDPLCVVPLCRFHHQMFDEGKRDLLPCLVPRFVPELQHALDHYHGDLIALLQRLTGERYVPERRAA